FRVVRPNAFSWSGGCPCRALQRSVDPPQRLLATEQRDALEDPGRDGRARDRDADGLEDLLRLPAARLDERAQRRLDRVLVEWLGQRGERLARRGERLRPALGTDRPLPRGRVVGRSVVEEAGERPEVGKRLDLLAADLDPGAQAAAAGERLQAVGQVLDRQAAQVVAVEVAQLLLVEDGGRLRDALQTQPARQLLAREDLLLGGEAGAEQCDVIDDRLGQVAGVA